MTSSQFVTPDHLTQINQALAQIQTLKSELDLAQRAGLDVTRLVQQITEREAQLRQFRQTYFPNG